MSSFDRLRKAGSLGELAPLLGFTPQGLSFVLYKAKPETFYTTFEIPKKGGGLRKIHAPQQALKLLQKRLADFLYACLHEIEAKYPVRTIVSHGFEKGRSIVTNASAHRRRRYVLNLDIADFFGSINFGRVRGYFIHDKDFALKPPVATVISQIACHQNALPQGSPSSPVISNLIGAILDRRLIVLAKRYGCTYTRYADDLTLSTHLRQFPRALASERLARSNEWRLGYALKREIRSAGFSINPTIATPPMTRAFADDHFGFSKTIPIATAKLAAMAADNKMTWGRKGSSEPEKNALIYLYLCAAIGWFVVAIIAAAKFLWLRKYPPYRGLKWKL